MSLERSLLNNSSFDHDGTVANSRKAVTLEFNKRFATHHDVEELNYYNAITDWSLSLGKSADEAKAINYEFWYTPDTLLKAEPSTRAIEFLYSLYRQDIKFFINSSRIPLLRESTIAWYQKHAPFVEERQILTGLPGIDGKDSKIRRIKANESQLHLDDVVDHVQHILTHHNKVYIVLFSVESVEINSRLTHIVTNQPNFQELMDLFNL